MIFAVSRRREAGAIRHFTPHFNDVYASASPPIRSPRLWYSHAFLRGVAQSPTPRYHRDAAAITASHSVHALTVLALTTSLAPAQHRDAIPIRTGREHFQTKAPAHGFGARLALRLMTVLPVQGGCHAAQSFIRPRAKARPRRAGDSPWRRPCGFCWGLCSRCLVH